MQLKYWIILWSEIIIICIIIVMSIYVIKNKRSGMEQLNESLVPSLIVMSIVMVPSLFATIYCMVKPASDIVQTTIVICSAVAASIYLYFFNRAKKQKEKNK